MREPHLKREADVNDSEYGTGREERRGEIAETHVSRAGCVCKLARSLADLVNRISEMSSGSRIVASGGPEAASAHLRTRVKKTAGFRLANLPVYFSSVDWKLGHMASTSFSGLVIMVCCALSTVLHACWEGLACLL